jgi:hypothetical protein
MHSGEKTTVSRQFESSRRWQEAHVRPSYSKIIQSIPIGIAEHGNANQPEKLAITSILRDHYTFKGLSNVKHQNQKMQFL